MRVHIFMQPVCTGACWTASGPSVDKRHAVVRMQLTVPGGRELCDQRCTHVRHIQMVHVLGVHAWENVRLPPPGGRFACA